MLAKGNELVFILVNALTDWNVLQIVDHRTQLKLFERYFKNDETMFLFIQ